MPEFIEDHEVPQSLTQLAQINEFGKYILFYWHEGEERVYINECYPTANFWHSQQNDTVISSLERLGGLTGNVTYLNTMIMDGQNGGRPAPADFMMRNWSWYVVRREALAFEVKKEYLPLYSSLPLEAEEPVPSLEYIAASEVFGY